MVVRILLLTLALLPFTAVAAPQLSLIVNKTETQLGKPLRAELVAVDSGQALAALDLQPLRENFGVVTEESASNLSDSRWPGQSVQVLRLLLYPRQTGELRLPVLRLGETHSEAQNILVSDGSISGAPIGVVTHLSTNSPWERQRVVLQLEVTTPDLFSALEAAAPLQAPDFDVEPLPREREQRGAGAEKRAVLRLGWVLSPRTAGSHNIDLPAIRYNLSGRAERIYYFPTARLHVRPLPPYVPPTLPVGKVSVTSSLSSNDVLYPDTLTYWTVTVDGETVTPRGLPPILRQLESGDRLRFLAIDSQRTWQAETRRSQVVHHIPFKPLASGRLALPELHLQYFDPDTGRLVRINHTPPRPWVLSLTWRVVIGAVLALLASGLLVLLFRVVRRALQHHRERNAALAAIRRAKDARQLRQALESVAHAEGFPPNLSLREWAAHWRARHRANPDFDHLVSRLSRACYGNPMNKDENAELIAAFEALYRH